MVIQPITGYEEGKHYNRKAFQNATSQYVYIYITVMVLSISSITG